MSQSAVSQSIANPKARVDTVQFERVGNRLVPTPESIAST